MAVPAKLDELHLRNTAESRADDAESRNGRRLPHNSGRNVILFTPSGKSGTSEGPIRCRERLGGLLRYYHREAA